MVEMTVETQLSCISTYLSFSRNVLKGFFCGKIWPNRQDNLLCFTQSKNSQPIVMAEYNLHIFSGLMRPIPALIFHLGLRILNCSYCYWLTIGLHTILHLCLHLTNLYADLLIS